MSAEKCYCGGRLEPLKSWGPRGAAHYRAAIAETHSRCTSAYVSGLKKSLPYLAGTEAEKSIRAEIESVERGKS